jgi:hypothetical protein
MGTCLRGMGRYSYDLGEAVKEYVQLSVSDGLRRYTEDTRNHGTGHRRDQV